MDDQVIDRRENHDVLQQKRKVSSPHPAVEETSAQDLIHQAKEWELELKDTWAETSSADIRLEPSMDSRAQEMIAPGTPARLLGSVPAALSPGPVP